MTAVPTGPMPDPPVPPGRADSADPRPAPTVAAVADPPRVVREIEHKFRVHGLFELPDLSALDSVGGTDDLGGEDVDSTYVDTADLRLIREGFALRRRSGSDDEGWHLKLPVAGADSSVHDELRVPLTATGEPPRALTHLVHAIVRDAALTDVARLRGRRHRLMIRDTDDVGVAVLVDDTMEVLDRSGEITARFRELELDPLAVASTTGRVVDDVADALSRAGGLGGDFVAKVVRALGPRATAPPEVPDVPPPPSDDADASVADAAAATLARTIRTFRATDLDLRRAPDDPSTIHKARVAARRLRTALRTYRPWLDKDRTTALIAALKDTGDVLGRLRELDVVTLQLLDGVDALPERSDTTRDHIVAVLGRRREAARDDVLALLESPGYLDLHEALVAAVQDPLTTDDAATTPAVDALPAVVGRRWKKLTTLVDRLSDTSADADWHHVRLAAKRVRYTAEAVAPGVGTDATRFAGAISEVTDLLGEQHDAVVAEQVAASVAVTGESGAEVRFTLGRVAAGQRDLAGRAASDFPDVWKAAARPKLRGWFAG